MTIKKTLFVPGLNLHPNQMQSFAKQVSNDYTVLTLPGIDPNNKKQKVNSFEEWIDAVENEIKQNQYEALVGFSLGGLLVSSLIHRKIISAENYKICLIAPALRIFPHSWLPEKIFKTIKIPSLPSLQKSQFIVHRFTPRELYLALYEGLKHIENDLNFLNHKNILCYLHSKDELVWSKKIKDEIEGIENRELNLRMLSHKAQLGKHLHHLCFHPDNLTNNDFLAFSEHLTQFLDS
jgi:esterase/lipase